MFMFLPIQKPQQNKTSSAIKITFEENSKNQNKLSVVVFSFVLSDSKATTRYSLVIYCRSSHWKEHMNKIYC